MASMLEAHAACEETQWLGMRMWMEDRERKWDVRHEDNVLLERGIMDMVTKILAGARAG